MNKNTIKIFPIILGVILVVIAVLLQLKRESEAPDAALSYAETQESVKKFASDFSTFEVMEGPERVKSSSVVYNEDGKPIALSSFKGKVVIVNLWATWCAPCVAELPALAKLKNERPDDVEVIAVSLDLQKTPAELRDFLDKTDAEDLDVFTDKGTELNIQFPNRGLPTSYIINPKGKITYKMEGDADWSSPDALTFIDFIKAEK